MNAEKVSNTKDRIKELLEKYKITQADMASKTGLPTSTVSRYVSGTRMPKQDAIDIIAMAYEVDPAWLMGYAVPMHKVMIESIDTDKITELTIGKYQYLWASVIKLMELPRSNQESICEIINTLHSARK